MTGPHAVSEPLLLGYVTAVATGLVGPRRHRERILAEVRDGLDHAVDNHAAHGLGPQEAIRATINEFGTPTAIAAAFADELGTATARRTLGWFVVTGPMVGVWWLMLLHPQPWRAGALALLTAIPVLPLVVVALATAAATFATTGRLIRWLPETGARQALGTVIAVGALVIGGDTALIAMAFTSGSPAGPLVIAAVAASAVRIGCGLTVVHHAAARRRGLADPAGRNARR